MSVESGVGWMPYLVESARLAVEELRRRARIIRRWLPSDYFRRQVYGSFWFEKDVAAALRWTCIPDNIMFETDFPHPTSLSPGPASIAETHRSRPTKLSQGYRSISPGSCCSRTVLGCIAVRLEVERDERSVRGRLRRGPHSRGELGRHAARRQPRTRRPLRHPSRLDRAFRSEPDPAASRKTASASSSGPGAARTPSPSCSTSGSPAPSCCTTWPCSGSTRVRSTTS